MVAYDAEAGPDEDAWMAADEQERIEAVREYHDALDHHPAAESMAAHAMIHAVVETQIAMEDPPETREKMEELVEAGVDRHAAIHALAAPVAHVVYGVAQGDDDQEFNDLVAQKVSAVTVQDGREQEKTWER